MSKNSVPLHWWLVKSSPTLVVSGEGSPLRLVVIGEGSP